MIYLVTGHPRSGTSAMMKALAHGGLVPFYSRERDTFMRERFGDEFYDLQGGDSLYEPTVAQVRDPQFPRNIDGQLIKVMYYDVPMLAPTDEMRVVFMWRDPEEIRQSFEAGLLGRVLPPWMPDGYDKHMRLALDHLRNRRDVLSVTEVQYREQLLTDPTMVFAGLRAEGWPIAVAAAASQVDPSRCRFKRESLEVGI